MLVSGAKIFSTYFSCRFLYGKLPYWPGSLYNAHLEPAAKEIEIVGHFGWHTFRHTYATLLKGNGEDVKVVQELMRHANISVTLSEEIRNGSPLVAVLPEDIVSRATLIASVLCAGREHARSISSSTSILSIEGRLY